MMSPAPDTVRPLTVEVCPVDAQEEIPPVTGENPVDGVWMAARSGLTFDGLDRDRRDHVGREVDSHLV
jgi:hypothetical protein